MFGIENVKLSGLRWNVKDQHLEKTETTGYVNELLTLYNIEKYVLKRIFM